MKVTDEVYREYSQMVYKYLFSLTGDARVAEEVTQETFYQAVRCAGRFDGSCRFSTWLCAIAKNQLNSYRRKHFPNLFSLFDVLVTCSHHLNHRF